MNRTCVTLLSDLGAQDSYVAQLKGVAAAIDPSFSFIDLTHEIPPRDIRRAAFLWRDAVAAFPLSSIHVGAIDPLGDCELIAADICGQHFVCPDNGLLSVILQGATADRVVRLDNPRWWRAEDVTHFRARDVLVPVAIALRQGLDLTEIGSVWERPLNTFALPEVARSRSALSGAVIQVDRFGNLLTNIDVAEVPGERQEWQVEVGPLRIIGISRSYSAVDSGEPVAVAGSGGRLEIAIRDGSAAEELQIEYGRRVIVRHSGIIA